MKEKPMTTPRNQSKTGKRRAFALGEIVVTPGVAQTIEALDCHQALQRHAGGDWGSCSAHDWEENALALDNGWPLFSLYYDQSGTPFWIVTEADRSMTLILLPAERDRLPG